MHKQGNMNKKLSFSAVVLIATAFLTSSIVAGPSIVYANSYGGLGGLGGVGGLGSPLGVARRRLRRLRRLR